jgi:hypothetical protein
MLPCIILIIITQVLRYPACLDFMQLKGVGQWTADMVCMFNLGKPNILPTGDLGVRKVCALLGGGFKCLHVQLRAQCFTQLWLGNMLSCVRNAILSCSRSKKH